MSEESTAGPQPVALPPYGLRWAIKPSFVAYVSRMRDGRALVGNGAAVNERNELIFPLDEEASSDAETFCFGGAVQFTGHFGMLFVHIAQPQVTIGDGEAELTVLDPASKEGKRLRLVTLNLTGPEIEDDVERWEAAEVHLTPDGVELFGEVYQAGEPFAPLTITVPRREASAG